MGLLSPHQEKRATMSLRSLPKLVRRDARQARRLQQEFSQALKGRKDGVPIDFQQVSELLRILEEAKLYIERDVHLRIENATKLVQHLFKDHPAHLFATQEECAKAHKALVGAFRDLEHELSDERRDDRRARRGKRPRGTLFKYLLSSDTRLERKNARSARKEARLEHTETQLLHGIMTLIHELTTQRESLTIERIRDAQHKLTEHLQRYATLFKREVRILFSEEENILLHESDVRKQLREHGVTDGQLDGELDKLRAKLRKDYRADKRLRREAHALVHATSEEFGKVTVGERIPYVTEFKSGMVVLNVDDKKLIVLNPDYLLKKHDKEGREAGSKFKELKHKRQLYETIAKHVPYGKLTGNRVVLPNIDAGVTTGEDALVAFDPRHPRTLEELRKQWGALPEAREVRGNTQYVLPTKKRPPRTKLINLVLVTFDPQYGQGVDNDFYAKYNKGFDDFQEVYAVLTIFPGSYAPPAGGPAFKAHDPIVKMTGEEFWKTHALLQH